MGHTRMSKSSFAVEREAQGRGAAHGRAAWSVRAWCAALDLGRSTFYILDVRPRCIKVGKRLLIVESPADYATRVAQMQGETK